MLTTYSDVKQQLLDEWEYLSQQTYPEDSISEFADSAVPVYYSEIIAEWTDLPSEYTDRWQELGEVSPDQTIVGLMQTDLYLYYGMLFRQAFAELSKDLEEASAE